MLNTVKDFTLSILPPKHKSAPNGWIKFNAVCCPHNGETPDKRVRGGVIPNTDGGISYHCFNCGFRAHYIPGYHLNYKFRKLLSWFGASETEIKRLVIEAIRIKHLINPEELEKQPKQEIVFTPKPLPEHSISFQEMLTFYSLNNGEDFSEDFGNLVDYVFGRRIDMQKYDFYVSAADSMKNRVIVPFTWKRKIIGYTARSIIDNAKMRYINSFPSHYVFNVDKQPYDAKFVLVHEGPFDAMSTDGVAVMGSELTEQQVDIIEELGREVIVVPDLGISGKKLVDAAIEYGWSVSFPVWLETCKDANAAVQKYGHLFVLKTILDAKETSRLKIELMKKRWYA